MQRTLETYADGMGIPFPVIRALYLRRSRTSRGRCLAQMRRLETRWQERERRLGRRIWRALVARWPWIVGLAAFAALVAELLRRMHEHAPAVVA